MSNKTDSEKRIVHDLEKIKLEINKTSMTNSDIENSAPPAKQEENLIIPPETTLVTDRNFINLDWTKLR